MKLMEFIQTMSYGQLKGVVTNRGTIAKRYNDNLFYLPRIYCKDGFNISVQVHNGSYSASENGYREFGYEWGRVEWGFPSQEIDNKEYCCEDLDADTTNSVGSCDVKKLDGLLRYHGGIDIVATLKADEETIKQSEL